ncbi:unnamed protein product [Orchesella dallaii]|uniref:Zinc transporter ZIP9 n=1 Tax=Orchesella dallaii TaxID=48710 RepID=A0ABP1QSP8_9HEXA
MDPAVGLIFLSGVMLIGSFLAGAIPIVMHMSEEKIHLISVVGAGLLVGTALSVIIPEGMHTLYLAQMQKGDIHKIVPSSPSIPQAQQQPDGGYVPPIIAHPTHSSSIHLANEESSEPFASVGIALVLGFAFMMLVDQCSRSRSNRDIESSGFSQKKSFTATLGLVVHAAADGVALGAAATTPHAEVEMIVFFAIMLHKAPAAFGLVTFLLHEGLDRNRVRRHLAVFSLAAPVMAIITYFGISQEGKQDTTTMNATALAMLFSAGTFLYVATVHVLPEVTKDSQNGFSRKEMLCLIVGIMLPLLFTSGHHH